LKKNIAFYNIYKIWGGGERWQLETALYLKKRGHQVLIFTPEFGELGSRAKDHGIDVISINWTKYSYFNLFRLIKLFFQFKKLRLDTIFFNSFMDVREVGVLSLLSKIRKRIYRVGNPTTPKNSLYMRTSIKLGVNMVNYISDDIQKVFNNQMPFALKGKKTSLITNGVDLNTFSRLGTKLKNEIVIGNCARLSPEKGFEDFMKIAEKFKRHSSVKFLIAGDGDQKEDLILLRDKMGLENQVKFLGNVEDTPSFYKKLDILLFTSKYEGSSRTIIEAFCSSLPVVCFDISSMKELVDNGVNGFKSIPFDIDMISSNLIKLVENEKMRIELGKNAREKAELKYDKVKIFKKWEKIICGD